MSRPFTKESFDSKHKKTDNGCWEWVATKNQDGYGRIKRFGKLESAHRVSYELYKGELGDKHVLHSCDNPSCVNPEHLWLGTHLENQQDKARKGRAKANPMPGEKHPKHKLNTEQALFIKDSVLPVRTLMHMFSVSEMLIYGIRNGTKWKHLTTTT